MSEKSLKWIKLALSHYMMVLKEMENLPDDCQFFAEPNYEFHDAVNELSEILGIAKIDLMDW